MTYEELKETSLAFASKAWRNSGLTAPITVMFECWTPRGMSAHQRMVSRALGGNSTSRKNYLMSYTEENFNKDFGQFGFNSESIEFDYLNAIEINVTSFELYGEDLILRRIETTDENMVKNSDGTMKPQWSIKKVFDQELTFDGALIYQTTEFAEPGMADARLQHDQNLSRSLNKMSAGSSIGNIKENKAKAIAAEVEAAF